MLIWVFAGHTGLIVGFVTRWLKYHENSPNNIYRGILRPQGCKTFFMLNSAEHEICLANKSQIANSCKFVLAQLAEYENFSADKYENANNSWHFHIY